jgi:hypothetical protein
VAFVDPADVPPEIRIASMQSRVQELHDQILGLEGLGKVTEASLASATLEKQQLQAALSVANGVIEQLRAEGVRASEAVTRLHQELKWAEDGRRAAERRLTDIEQRLSQVDLGELARQYQHEQQQLARGRGGGVEVAFSDPLFAAPYAPIVDQLLCEATDRRPDELRAFVTPAMGGLRCGLLIYVAPSSYSRFDSEQDRRVLYPYRDAGRGSDNRSDAVPKVSRTVGLSAGIRVLVILIIASRQELRQADMLADFRGWCKVVQFMDYAASDGQRVLLKESATFCRNIQPLRTELSPHVPARVVQKGAWWQEVREWLVPMAYRVLSVLNPCPAPGSSSAIYFRPTHCNKGERRCPGRKPALL